MTSLISAQLLTEHKTEETEVCLFSTVKVSLWYQFVFLYTVPE